MSARGYVIVDTETNALPDYHLAADAPGQPRLAAASLIQVTPDLALEALHTFLIRPEGWGMTPEATAVNGLTDAVLEASGSPVATVLDRYSELVLAGRAVLAWNSRFDTKVLRGELRLAGRPDLFEETPNWCVMRAATPLCGLRNARGGAKWPDLDEALTHFHIPRTGKAHTTVSDAKACLDVARALVAHGVPITPKVHYAKARAA